MGASEKRAATYHPAEDRVWIPCPCVEIETRFIPESGCPSCDDQLGHWIYTTTD